MSLSSARTKPSGSVSSSAWTSPAGVADRCSSRAAPDAVVLHPGPMNRGVEIADEVADLAERSLILRQVANGVAMRMAVLEMLVGS